MPHEGQTTAIESATLSKLRHNLLTVLWTEDLMDHVIGVIVAVDVTLMAVEVVRIILFVLDHSLL